MGYRSSEGRDTGKLTQVFRSVKTVLGKGAGQGAVGVGTLPITATGGNTILTPGDGWKYHLFTSTGNSTFTVTNVGPGFVEVILVGGGGGGGGGSNSVNAWGSGGGAGGVFYKKSIPISTSPGTYIVGVGTGGSGGNGDPAGGVPGAPISSGANGSPSVGFGFTAYGGAGGGRHPLPGGTAGPGGDTSNPRTGNQESPPVGWGWPNDANLGGGAGGTPTGASKGIVMGNFYFSEGGGIISSKFGSDYTAGHGGAGGNGAATIPPAAGGPGSPGTPGIVVIRYRNV